MSGHTPGPWVHESFRAEQGRREEVWTQSGDRLARIYHGSGRDAPTNARLFASSPELLEALQQALDAYGPWTGKTSKQERADEAMRAAITKAIGTEGLEA